MTSGANLKESHKQIFSNLKDVFSEKVDHDVILLVLTECEWKGGFVFLDQYMIYILAKLHILIIWYGI